MSAVRRILIVDDNAAQIENLTEILVDAGYEVLSAGSCQRARELGRTGFNVALIDVRLPDGDGIELSADLRQISPEAEIILLTGYATVESAAAAVRAGACAYLMKPCATADLLMTVDKAIRQVVLVEEKAELRRRAQVAEKLAAVGTLTAGLSHEIRNPLNSALLQLTVLERRLSRLPDGERKQLQEPLDLVRDEIERLDHILEDFLQFARPRELASASVDLVLLCNRVLDLVAPNAEARHIKVRRALADVGEVRGDPQRLQQVVMNLVLNALQAAPDGGLVAVETSRHGNAVLMAVEDNGPGIAPEARSRIFEPFFTTKPSGSGLGLPIVHGIIEQHRGHIEVRESSAGGARFEVKLPAF